MVFHLLKVPGKNTNMSSIVIGSLYYQQGNIKHILKQLEEVKQPARKFDRQTICFGWVFGQSPVNRNSCGSEVKSLQTAQVYGFIVTSLTNPMVSCCLSTKRLTQNNDPHPT